MNWSRAIAEATGLGCIFLVLAALVLVASGHPIMLHHMGEAWFEIPFVVIGLILYIKYHRIRFTLHPKKRLLKNSS